jgi:hypothetical protein
MVMSVLLPTAYRLEAGSGALTKVVFLSLKTFNVNAARQENEFDLSDSQSGQLVLPR